MDRKKTYWDRPALTTRQFISALLILTQMLQLYTRPDCPVFNDLPPDHQVFLTQLREFFFHLSVLVTDRCCIPPEQPNRQGRKNHRYKGPAWRPRQQPQQQLERKVTPCQCSSCQGQRTDGNPLYQWIPQYPACEVCVRYGIFAPRQHFCRRGTNAPDYPAELVRSLNRSRCDYCGEYGHFPDNCPKRPKPK